MNYNILNIIEFMKESHETDSLKLKPQGRSIQRLDN